MNKNIDVKYIEWIENFSNKYNTFSFDDFMFNVNIDEIDRENLGRLNDLFIIIKKYVSNNYLIEDKEKFLWDDLCIRYNDNKYLIGYKIDGTMCKKINKYNGNIINIHDVFHYYKKINDKENKQKLVQLRDCVEKMIDEDICYTDIENTINKVLAKKIKIWR